MVQSSRAVLMWIVVWYAILMVPPHLLETRWRRIGPDHEARKWPALRQFVSTRADRPLLVMLGSSRVCWAFRAGSLEGMPDSDGRPLAAFNYGIPATGPISDLFYLRDMLAEGIRPRLVLLEFLPPLMCKPERGVASEEALLGFENLSTHRFLQWLPYLHRPKKMAHMWLESCINPWYAYRQRIHLEAKCLVEGKPFPTYEPLDDWGWRLSPATPFLPVVRQTLLQQDRLGYALGLSHFQPGTKPLQAFRETLDLCRREKIPVALVWMPESSEFRSWYSAEAKATIHGLLDELRQTYGMSVIDASAWLPDEDFEDGHHTLRHGAEVFTSRLRDQLPRLLAESAAVRAIQ